ncbi:unnamed protein product, partial [Ascophyllum nodosum]
GVAGRSAERRVAQFFPWEGGALLDREVHKCYRHGARNWRRDNVCRGGGPRKR